MHNYLINQTWRLWKDFQLTSGPQTVIVEYHLVCHMFQTTWNVFWVSTVNVPRNLRKCQNMCLDQWFNTCKRRMFFFFHNNPFTLKIVLQNRFFPNIITDINPTCWKYPAALCQIQDKYKPQLLPSANNLVLVCWIQHCLQRWGGQWSLTVVMCPFHSTRQCHNNNSILPIVPPPAVGKQRSSGCRHHSWSEQLISSSLHQVTRCLCPLPSAKSTPILRSYGGESSTWVMGESRQKKK